MALINELEKRNFLFKYRGQIPVVLFVLAIPFIYTADLSAVDEKYIQICKVVAITISILGFVVRAITIATTPNFRKKYQTTNCRFFNSTGIYSIVRHHLYLELPDVDWYSFVCLLYFVLIVSLLYWLYYERIMFAEERFLQKSLVRIIFIGHLRSLLFCSFSNYVKSEVSFSFKSILRREYSGVLATVIGFVFVELARNYFVDQCICISNGYWFTLVVVLAFSLILRTIKKTTTLLDESGRS